ncbi:MAG: DsbA family oxidoreductase [Actinomycetia bacterium]|nr:DsbA family oxidoreductase [Actinomycetes bacterium]
MQVEIWSDVVCPWCYIGKRRFEEALRRFDGRDDVEVTWRSFELDPDAPPVGIDVLEHLADKYGVSKGEAQAMQHRVTQAAAGEGLEYHLDRTQRGNSFNAHRLLHLAKEHGRQAELEERLFRGYFTDGEAIGDTAVLRRLAVEAGLPEADVEDVLDSDRYADAVRDDERTAQQLGARGVPFFVVDRTYGASGAQDPDLLVSLLEQAAAEP